MQVDNTVGRIIDILEQTGYDNETLLIFTCDNGPLWYIDDLFSLDDMLATMAGITGDKLPESYGLNSCNQLPDAFLKNIIMT